MGSDYSIHDRVIIANLAMIGHSLKFRTILHRDLERQKEPEGQSLIPCLYSLETNETFLRPLG